jgi:Dolichyl-phosphate-mannose-protein mannosyltransferase
MERCGLSPVFAWKPSPHGMTLDRVHRWWPVLGGIAFVTIVAALHAWSLLRFPAPFVDEAWFGSRAWALASGRTFSSLDHGVIDQFPRAWFFFPLLPNLIYAAALTVAGSPSLLPLRMVSLAAGTLLGVAVWRSARTIGGPRAAWLSVGLLSTSATFILSAHLARYDILAAALAYLGASIYLCRRHGDRMSMLASALCAGAALEMHPFGAVVLVGLGSAIAYDTWGRRTDATDIVVFAGGGAIVAVTWVCIHVLPDVSTFVSLNKLIFVPTHAPTEGRSAAEFAAGGVQTAWLLGVMYGTALPLVGVSLLFALFSADWQLRRSGIMAAGATVAFALLIRNQYRMYLIQLTPALDVCAGVVLSAWWSKWRHYPERILAVSTLSAVLVVHAVASNIQLLRRDMSEVFSVVERRLTRSIRPRDTIIGSQTYWFGLQDHEYYSWEQLVYLRRYRPELSASQALGVLKPTVLIRDAHWDQFLRDDPGPTLYQRLLTVPRTELETWLAQHAEVVDDFDGDHYGRIRVYRLDWSEEAAPARPK